MSSEWAEELARKKRLELENKRSQADRALREQQLVQRDSEAMWADLVQEVSSHVIDVNEAWGEQPVLVTAFPEPDSVEIEIEQRRVASVRFADHRNGIIRVDFQGPELRLNIGSNGELDWKSAETGQRWTNKELARLIVEHAFKSLQE